MLAMNQSLTEARHELKTTVTFFHRSWQKYDADFLYRRLATELGTLPGWKTRSSEVLEEHTSLGNAR
jgi:hypothetical protein